MFRALGNRRVFATGGPSVVIAYLGQFRITIWSETTIKAKKYWKQIVPYVHISFSFKHLDLYKPCMKVALKGNALTECQI